MLRLLLDEQISPTVAQSLQARCPSVRIFSLADWKDGIYLSAPDEEILIAASHERITLVTYDLKTIGPILKSWGEQGSDHSGVIFIDDKTIRSEDFGGLVLALEELTQRQGRMDWKNQVVFLERYRK
jgi:hypothetical protein